MNSEHGILIFGAMLLGSFIWAQMYGPEAMLLWAIVWLFLVGIYRLVSE